MEELIVEHAKSTKESISRSPWFAICANLTTLCQLAVGGHIHIYNTNINYVIYKSMSMFIIASILSYFNTMLNSTGYLLSGY